jgi:hypothetical protein
VQAIVKAARPRLRPILMTSFASILGALPLVTSSGPSAEMRQAMGIAVFFGMLGVTLFGLLFTPGFYVVVRHLSGARAKRNRAAPPERLARQLNFWQDPAPVRRFSVGGRFRFSG